MASELTMTIAGSVTKNTETTVLPGVTALGVTVTGNQILKDVLTVTNADTTIPLGGITVASAVLIVKNLDATNAISIRIAAAGTKVVRLLAGECWAIRMDSGWTAPTAIADAGSPLMAYGLIPL